MNAALPIRPPQMQLIDPSPITPSTVYCLAQSKQIASVPRTGIAHPTLQGFSTLIRALAPRRAVMGAHRVPLSGCRLHIAPASGDA